MVPPLDILLTNLWSKYVKSIYEFIYIIYRDTDTSLYAKEKLINILSAITLTNSPPTVKFSEE